MFYHGLALIFVALMQDRYPRPVFKYVGWLFVAGSILFQGNLFMISLAGASPLSFLAPVGGICLMAAWLLLAVGAIRIPKRNFLSTVKHRQYGRLAFLGCDTVGGS